MLSKNPALIVIDVQKGIDESDYWGGNRNNPQAEENILLLIDHWRANGLPIFFVKHDSTNEQSPFHPTRKGNALKEFIMPREGDALVIKSTANAFVNTSLREELSLRQIRAGSCRR